MDNLAPVRAFFKELITPIVTDAVKQVLPNADENGGRKPVKPPQSVSNHPPFCPTIGGRWEVERLK